MRPDIIIHAAAESDVDRCELKPDDAWAANVQATQHVVEAARGCGARLLHVSSDYVFDGLQRSPYAETDAPHPVSHYGRTKLAAEEAVRRAAVPWLIIRPSTLFGPGRPSFVDKVIRLGEAGEPVLAFADQTTSPSYTRDLAEGTARLLEAHAEGIVHLANEGAVSRVVFARAVLDGWGLSRAVIREVPMAAAQLPAKRPPNSSLAMTRIQAVTGWRPRQWREALHDYLQWKKQSLVTHG